MRDLTLVFDLDGTLVDTAPDLIASTNHVLDHLGLPRVDGETLRPFVGHGAKHMIERAVGPAAESNDARASMRRCSPAIWTITAATSRSGAGRSKVLLPLLAKFQAAGVKLAVCTNKMEVLVATAARCARHEPLLRRRCGARHAALPSRTLTPC